MSSKILPRKIRRAYKGREHEFLIDMFTDALAAVGEMTEDFTQDQRVRLLNKAIDYATDNGGSDIVPLLEIFYAGEINDRNRAEVSASE
tara:strand:- start:197 stop:463 length:267 start_codon:yes stop_codon:yes gene_type:complete